jgi:hypothetical protein
MRHGPDLRIWLLALIGVAVGLTIYFAAPSYRLASGATTTGLVALIVLKHLGMLAAVASPFGALARTARVNARRLLGRDSGEAR